MTCIVLLCIFRIRGLGENSAENLTFASGKMSSIKKFMNSEYRMSWWEADVLGREKNS